MAGSKGIRCAVFRHSTQHNADCQQQSGVEFPHFPRCLEGPKERLVVADMSSNFLSRKVDVSKYAVIYGGAQKVGHSYLHPDYFATFSDR